MDSISKFVSQERDVAYMVAQEKEQAKFVANLLSKSEFSLKKIADVAGVSIGFVKAIQQKISSKN